MFPKNTVDKNTIFFAATAWRLLADSDPPPERYLFHILLWGKTSLKRTIFKGLAHRTYGLQRHP